MRQAIPTAGRQKSATCDCAYSDSRSHIHGDDVIADSSTNGGTTNSGTANGGTANGVTGNGVTGNGVAFSHPAPHPHRHAPPGPGCGTFTV